MVPNQNECMRLFCLKFFSNPTWNLFYSPMTEEPTVMPWTIRMSSLPNNPFFDAISYDTKSKKAVFILKAIPEGEAAISPHGEIHRSDAWAVAHAYLMTYVFEQLGGELSVSEKMNEDGRLIQTLEFSKQVNPQEAFIRILDMLRDSDAQAKFLHAKAYHRKEAFFPRLPLISSDEYERIIAPVHQPQKTH